MNLCTHYSARNTFQIWLLAAGVGLACIAQSRAHIVPPETLHPAVESYRRMMFLLNLNPVPWNDVQAEASIIESNLETISRQRATRFRSDVNGAVASLQPDANRLDPITPETTRAAATTVFETSTHALADLFLHAMSELKAGQDEPRRASDSLELASKLWAAFEPEIRATDPMQFQATGMAWLRLSTALNTATPTPGRGASTVDAAVVTKAADELIAYVRGCHARFKVPAGSRFAPIPSTSATFDPTAQIPMALPPGSNINKQRPRPRQILNFASRGGNETKSPLIALGDMTFDSPLIFGEPARSLGISCNTCHNKGVTNPRFRIPGLTTHAGGVDVSNAFFAPHADNGVFDPLDIPDLRGIRFTAPYGRNGRFASLREFTRNVIVNEFNGPEPDPLILDAMMAYMLEFDFLPNPKLNRDGSLKAEASEAARRGQTLFNKTFPQMGGMSCASCHDPSDHFLDRRSHDIGSVPGAAPHSLDRALDTPTLLGAAFTAPYFHDGSLATLRDVVVWFDRSYQLALTTAETSDLAEYLETIGDGTAGYEEDPDAAAPAEVEEQYLFMASWEFLRDRGRTDLADILFRSVATELRNEKWDLRHPAAMEIVEELARMAEECATTSANGDLKTANQRISEFRTLYRDNAPLINGQLPPRSLTLQADETKNPTRKLP